MPEELRRIPRRPPASATPEEIVAWKADKKRRQEQANQWRAENCGFPNQLRHNAATKARKESGLETAQIICGHSQADTMEIYAEVDRLKAMECMKQFG